MRRIKRIVKKIIATTMAVAIMVSIMEKPIWALADDEVGQLDPVFYAATYPDLSGIANDPLALFQHYAEHGIFEGRIPYAGAQPGEPINGYATVGINPDLAANATVAEQTDATVATATISYDLSDWTPEMLVAYAQKQAEFDASGLVHVGWTETQTQTALFALKNLYPENMIVGECESGAGEILAALYGVDMEWIMGNKNAQGGMDLWLDKSGNRVMPAGYVEKKQYVRGAGLQGNIRDIRVGDVLYTKGSGAGHVSVVLSRDEKGITIVESNLGGDKKFHWGRKFTWNELENGTNKRWYKYTHYMY